MKPKLYFILSLLFVFSSCGLLKNIDIEKRVYRPGFYFNKYHKELRNTTSTSFEELNFYNMNEKKAVFFPFSSDSMIDHNSPIGIVHVISGNNKKQGKRQDTSAQNIRSVISKDLERDGAQAYVKEPTHLANEYDIPCTDKGKNLRYLSLALMLIGLLLLSVVNISPPLGVIGILVGIAGLALYFKAKKIPAPHIIKTEIVRLDSVNFNKSKFKTPVFDFEPPGKIGSGAKVSLALIRPQFAENFKFRGDPLFVNFANRMNDDFKEMLTARQYSYREFDDYGEMVFGDKSKVDMLLRTEITVELDEKNLQATPIIVQQYKKRYWSCGVLDTILGGKVTEYVFEGSTAIKATITMKASEIMTDEKVWVKSIELPPQNINIRSDRQYPGVSWSPMDDPGYFNPVASLLEEYYKTTMNKAWVYLDPYELEALKPQIIKIRSESGFIRR